MTVLMIESERKEGIEGNIEIVIGIDMVIEIGVIHIIVIRRDRIEEGEIRVIWMVLMEVVEIMRI